MPADAPAVRAGSHTLHDAPVNEPTARKEARLVRRAQHGDSEAVEALFIAHWPVCHRAAWLITRDAAAAEDIAQEAFVAAMNALDRFDRSRRLGPWLRTIVVRRAIDHTRARSARREVDAEALGQLAAPVEAPQVPSDDLIAAVGELSLNRRIVIVLRFFLDMTPREIAGLLDLPVGTVNSRMRRALDELRRMTETNHG